jgi:hypothetical protein
VFEVEELTTTGPTRGRPATNAPGWMFAPEVGEAMLFMYRVAVVELVVMTVFATTDATVVGEYTLSVELAGKKMFDALAVFANAIVTFEGLVVLPTVLRIAYRLESGV